MGGSKARSGQGPGQVAATILTNGAIGPARQGAGASIRARDCYGKTLLVTGGCGFIGANFVRLLLADRPGWRVINLDKLTYAGNLDNLREVADHPNYTFVRGDICDPSLVAELFARERIDTVVHFAAESHVDRSIDDPDAFIRTNIHGTFTLLEAARRSWPADAAAAGHRFLHVSTDEVFGSLGPTGLFTETTAYDPRSPYSASKASLTTWPGPTSIPTACRC